MNQTTNDVKLLTEIDTILAERGATNDALLAILDRTLTRFDCVTGSIHLLSKADNMLELLAQRGIPEAILDRVRHIPIGKGMAGIAAERLAPVQVCNLQTDDSGVAKPGAKMTEMKGSIAAPMFAGNELRGTIGVAKPQEYEFTPQEQTLLLEIGQRIAVRL